MRAIFQKISCFNLVLLYFLVFFCSCSEVDFNSIKDRYHENTDGGLYHPGDVSVADSNNFSFLLYGDIHVGHPKGDLLDDILVKAQELGVDFMIMLGDLTETGKDEQFSQFMDHFANVNIPFRAAMGNHDILLGGWDNYKKYVGRSMYSFVAGNTRFVAIDSANGQLGKDQLRWIEDRLKDNKQENLMVMSHFPPWVGKFGSVYQMDSEEEAAYFKNLLHRYHVDYMLSGHYHGHRQNTFGNTKYLVTGGANHKLDAGSPHAILVRVRGKEIVTQMVDLPQ